MDTLLRDIRFGVRTLIKKPGFTIVAVLSLALGVGANAAIFQLLDAVRLRSLPVARPNELAEVKIANSRSRSGNFSGRHANVTNAMWEQIRDRQQVFSSVFAWGNQTLNLAQGGEGHYAQALWVSGEFFTTLEIRPLLGRVFSRADDVRGCGSPSVVISYPFWQRQYGGDLGVVGRKLTLEGHPFDIIGVTPATFFGVEIGRSFDIAAPICAEPIVNGEDSALNNRSGWRFDVIGRLKPGWSLEKATAQLDSISPGVFQETLPPNYNAKTAKGYLAFKLGAFPAGTGVSSLRSDYENPIWILLALAGLVLLIACANLANLLLARATAREREIAVRMALGASRGRLIRQLLAESMLLALAGALLGAALAHVLSGSLVSFLSTQGNPLFVDLGLNWHMLAFTAGLAISTCVLFGLAPALRATRTTPGAALKAGSRGMTANRERFGLRRALVVSQVALSLVLLVGALLFSRSLRNLLTLDAGFQQDGVLVTSLDLTRVDVPKDRRVAYKQDLLRRVRTIPGVDAAAGMRIVPISGNGWNDNVLLGPEKKGLSFFNQVSAGYFKTLGTPLLAGRDFNENDTAKSPKVAIVNELFTHKFLTGENPIGKTFRVEIGPGEPDYLYEIIGVVKDAKYSDLRDEFEPVAYLSDSQDGSPDLSANLIVHSNLPLLGLTAGLKRAIGEVSPEITIDFRVFKTQIREGLAREQLMATLSGFFGLLAGLLAVIGLYGVMSYMVAQRRNEIGIRLALGASRSNILSMVMREATILLVIGLVVGTLLSLALAKGADSLLFGLRGHDPLTLVMAIVGLAMAGAAASFLPAQRAAGVDPMIALRDE